MRIKSATSSRSVSCLLQIFKQFTSGGKGSQQPEGMAMAEASKLFDKSGVTIPGESKTLLTAHMTVMKLIDQSKFKNLHLVEATVLGSEV